MKTKTIIIIIAILVLAAWVYYTYFAKKKVVTKTGPATCDDIPEDGYYYFAYWGSNSYLLDDFNANMCGNPFGGPNSTSLNNVYPALYIGTQAEVMEAAQKKNYEPQIMPGFIQKLTPAWTDTNKKNCCKSETVCNAVPGDKLFIEVINGPAFLDQKTVTVKQLGRLRCVQKNDKINGVTVTPVLYDSTQAIVIDQAVIPSGITYSAYQSSNKFASIENPVIGRFKKV